MQESEEIINEYEEYYKQLLTTGKPRNTSKTPTEEPVKKEIKSIMKQNTDSRREKITFSTVKKTVSTMKKRNAGGKTGWKAEWLIEGRDSMIKSLMVLYDRIGQEKIIAKK